jgi:serine/threonine protein kinase
MSDVTRTLSAITSRSSSWSVMLSAWRDIKPANILFAADGTIKVGDFGVANLNIGTRIYLSPKCSWVSACRAPMPESMCMPSV